MNLHKHYTILRKTRLRWLLWTDLRHPNGVDFESKEAAVEFAENIGGGHVHTISEARDLVAGAVVTPTLIDEWRKLSDLQSAKFGVFEFGIGDYISFQTYGEDDTLNFLCYGGWVRRISDYPDGDIYIIVHKEDGSDAAYSISDLNRAYIHSMLDFKVEREATPHLSVFAAFDYNLGRTVIKDLVTGTVLFEASEAAAEADVIDDFVAWFNDQPRFIPLFNKDQE